MIALNLTANGNEQAILKEYLQNNASETLAEKINNGVPITKNEIPIISKKSLDGFMKYACDEAKKQAEKGANSACIHSDTVFNWAIHYFEEDSIEGVLYNIDGTEFNPPKPKFNHKTTSATASTQQSKPQQKQQPSLFDLIEENIKVKECMVNEDELADIDDDDGDEIFTEDDKQEIAEEQNQVSKQSTVNIEPVKNSLRGSPIYQRYEQLQKQYPDAIIAMRLGDFYEALGASAMLLAEELDLTLTGRDCGLESRIPMVGFPYHMSDSYFKKICEKYKLIVVENADNLKIMDVSKQLKINETVDLETGEILTEEEMRIFDGDIEEPKEILNNSRIEKPEVIVTNTTTDNKIFNKLSELLGNILIAR